MFLSLQTVVLLLSYQEGPLYSSLPESVYVAAPYLLEDAEYQADPDPSPYSYLQGPLGTALRLSHRQLLEAQPKCLSNGESFEFKSNCCS